MKKDKLTLEELSAYFPYHVKAKFKCKNTDVEIGTIGQIEDGGLIVCYDTVGAYPTKFKLLLHPLSWLTNEVLSEINCDLLDQIEMEDFRDKFYSLHNMRYGVIQILLENHVDIFDLIKQGLAEELK